jgi:hypothetical protein
MAVLSAGEGQVSAMRPEFLPQSFHPPDMTGSDL